MVLLTLTYTICFYEEPDGISSTIDSLHAPLLKHTRQTKDRDVDQRFCVHFFYSYPGKLIVTLTFERC